MSYIPMLVWWRMDKSPSYGVCYFIDLTYFFLFRFRFFFLIAVLHLSGQQKINPLAFFCFVDMSHLSQQILLSSLLGKIFLKVPFDLSY